MQPLKYLTHIVFSIGLIVPAAKGQDIKSIIQQKNKERLAANKAKDISWFEKNTTSDFTEGVGSKSVPRAQAIGSVKKFFSGFHAANITQTVESMRIEGRNVRVLLKNHYVGTMGSSPTKLDVNSEIEELWVPVGTDYKMKHVETISQKVLVNGKPFNRKA